MTERGDVGMKIGEFKQMPAQVGEEKMRRVSMPLSRFGIDSEERVDGLEHTIPVYHSSERSKVVRLTSGILRRRGVEPKPATSMTLITAIERPVKGVESNTGRDRRTMVIVGGGSSGPRDNLGFSWQVENVMREAATNNPKRTFDVSKMVTLAHVVGSPRTKEPVDPAQEATLKSSAEIQYTALHEGGIRLSPDGVVLVGVSAGGAQVVELAALMGDECKQLILMEPAGMAEHPKMIQEISGGTAKAAYLRQRSRGEGRWAAVKRTVDEMRTAYGTPKGRAKLQDMFVDQIFKKRWYVEPGREHGILSSELATGAPNVAVLSSDSTKEAREKITAEVIFSPVVFAKVVNIMIDRMGMENELAVLKQEQDYDVRNKKMADITGKVNNELRSMFPNARLVTVVPYMGETHGDVFVEADQYLAPIAEAMYRTKADQTV